MKYELRVRVDWSKVRKVCIREDCYTRGDNDEYEHMLLEMCDSAEDMVDLEEIAEDILDHSDADALREKYDDDVETTILEYLINDCTWVVPSRIVPERTWMDDMVDDADELLEKMVRR